MPIASAASAVRRRYQHWWWLPGWLFAAVTQLPALLAMALLVPGTGMLLAGRLLPMPLLIIFVPLALALCFFAMRQLPVGWPRFGDPLPEPATPAEPAAPAVVAAEPAEPRCGPSGVCAAGPGRRPDVPLDALLATIAIAVLFAVWQAVEHSQQVIVVSDPGIYLQYGYWIATHGSARIPDSAAGVRVFHGAELREPGLLPDRCVHHARVHARAAAGDRRRRVARRAAGGAADGRR